MKVPHTALQDATLRAVIEEFVTREGTEYGESDVPLDEKVAAVRAQLDDGTAELTWDEETGTCTVAPTRPAARR